MGLARTSFHARLRQGKKETGGEAMTGCFIIGSSALTAACRARGAQACSLGKTGISMRNQPHGHACRGI